MSAQRTVKVDTSEVKKSDFVEDGKNSKLPKFKRQHQRTNQLLVPLMHRVSVNTSPAKLFGCCSQFVRSDFFYKINSNIFL
jgi:hypothetical protein